MKALDLKIEISKILKISVDELEENAGLGITHNWDSFGQVQIMMFLEDKFDIEIDEDSLEKYSTLENILEVFEIMI